jgi:hypothetical protein
MGTDITQLKFPFDWGRLNSAEFDLVTNIIGTPMKQRDFVLAPENVPYLYRWHIVKGPHVNVYLHIQVANGWRVPHDHPWDNQSVYLTDGAVETQFWPNGEIERVDFRHKGDVVSRKAATLHRLDLAPGADHAITLFTTGPKTREWGFLDTDGWHHNRELVDDQHGFSLGRKKLHA